MTFVFTTFSPLNADQAKSCNQIPGRNTEFYWYVNNTDNRVQLVSYGNNDNLPINVNFNVEFTGDDGNQAIISHTDQSGNIFYFTASNNNVVWTSSHEDASLWYFYPKGSNSPTNNINYLVLYVKLVDSNTYMMNYLKDSSGNFVANNILGLNEIPNEQTPDTLNGGALSCNYTFGPLPIETFNYSVVGSTLPLQIDDLKFNITTIGDRITIKGLRSHCYNTDETVICKPISDDLLFASGTKDSSAEFGFDKSYKVKLSIMSKIISQDNNVDNIDSIISIYNIGENYIIMRIYGKFFLLTNEINPSHNKLKCMRKRFKSFIMSIKCHKMHSMSHIHRR